MILGLQEGETTTLKMSSEKGQKAETTTDQKVVVDDLATGAGGEERDDPQGEAEVVVDLTEAGNGISSDTAEVTEPVV